MTIRNETLIEEAARAMREPWEHLLYLQGQERSTEHGPLLLAEAVLGVVERRVRAEERERIRALIEAEPTAGPVGILGVFETRTLSAPAFKAALLRMTEE